jgi:transposase
LLSTLGAEQNRKGAFVVSQDKSFFACFFRNKSLRLWMDNRGTTKNDLQINCAVQAREYPFAKRLNSQARQAAADRAWFAISRISRQLQHIEAKQEGLSSVPEGQPFCGVQNHRMET